MGTKSATHQPPGPLLTVEGLSQWLRIPKNTLYQQHSQGVPPGSFGVRIGRYLRYDRIKNQHWLDRGGQK
jgi:hypothetical protein